MKNVSSKRVSLEISSPIFYNAKITVFKNTYISYFSIWSPFSSIHFFKTENAIFVIRRHTTACPFASTSCWPTFSFARLSQITHHLGGLSVEETIGARSGEHGRWPKVSHLNMGSKSYVFWVEWGRVLSWNKRTFFGKRPGRFLLIVARSWAITWWYLSASIVAPFPGLSACKTPEEYQNMVTITFPAECVTFTFFLCTFTWCFSHHTLAFCFWSCMMNPCLVTCYDTRVKFFAITFNHFHKISSRC